MTLWRLIDKVTDKHYYRLFGLYGLCAVLLSGCDSNDHTKAINGDPSLIANVPSTQTYSVASSEASDKHVEQTSNILFVVEPSLTSPVNNRVPLSAVITFHSTQPVSARYSISDGTETWGWSEALYRTEHEQPLVYFKAGKRHQIQMDLRTEEGLSYSQTFVYHAPALPESFPDISASASSSTIPSAIIVMSLLHYSDLDKDLAATDMVNDNGGLVVAVNHQAEVIWYYQSPILVEHIERVEAGNHSVMRAHHTLRLSNHKGEGIMINMSGAIQEQWESSANRHAHDYANKMRELGNGNILHINGFQSFSPAGNYQAAQPSQLWFESRVSEGNGKTRKELFEVSALSKDKTYLWSVFDAMPWGLTDNNLPTVGSEGIDSINEAVLSEAPIADQEPYQLLGNKEDFTGNWSLQMQNPPNYHHRLYLHDNHQRDPEQVLAGTFNNRSVYARVNAKRIRFKVYDEVEGVGTLYNYQGFIDASGNVITGRVVIGNGTYAGSSAAWQAHRIR